MGGVAAEPSTKGATGDGTRGSHAGAPPVTPRCARSGAEAAAERLEQIIKPLDSGDAGLRETLDLVKESRTLVDYCAAELEAVGKGLDERASTS